jgi:hypothetical protein
VRYFDLVTLTLFFHKLIWSPLLFFTNSSVLAGFVFPVVTLALFFMNSSGHPGFIFHKLIWDLCYDFLNIFARKIGENIGVFFPQTTATFGQNLIITLVFEKGANIFAENCQKSPKIVIITSTPRHPGSEFH